MATQVVHCSSLTALRQLKWPIWKSATMFSGKILNAGIHRTTNVALHADW